jgi:hypothetical protein
MSKYEFIRVGKRYLVKNSNGRIVDEKTMLKMKNEELVLEDIKSNGCQGKITKEISKNKKRIKELENLEALKEVSPIVKGETALEEKEDADDTIEETNTTL